MPGGQRSVPVPATRLRRASTTARQADRGKGASHADRDFTGMGKSDGGDEAAGGGGMDGAGGSGNGQEGTPPVAASNPGRTRQYQAIAAKGTSRFQKKKQYTKTDQSFPGETP